MNKLIGISVAAILAVTPMLASATGSDPTPAQPSTGQNPGDPYLGVAVDSTAKIASTSFVQGAYNAAIGAVNAVANSKQDTLTSSNAGEGISISNGVISASGITVSEISGTTLVDSTDTIGAASGQNPATDTQIPTALAVRNAIADAISDAGGQTAAQVEDAIDAAAGAGLVTDNSGHLRVAGGDGITVDTTDDVVKVNADTTMFQFNGTSGALEIKNSGVGANQIADGSITTAKVDGTTLITSGETFADTDDTKLPTVKAVSGAITSALANGTDPYQTASDVSTAITNASTTTLATQTGVDNTIKSSYVTLYTDWAHPTYTTNVGITSQGYLATQQSLPAGVSQ